MHEMKDTEIMRCKHCTKVNKHLHLYCKEENKNYIMCLNCGEMFLKKIKKAIKLPKPTRPLTDSKEDQELLAEFLLAEQMENQLEQW